MKELTQPTMKPLKTLSITEARKTIFSIANEVQKPDTYYTLTENGTPKAVIMSAEEFESWQETLEVMADPELMERIKTADNSFKKGDFITLEDLLEKEGLIPKTLNKKPKDAKKAQTSTRKKSPKGSKKN